MIDAALHILAAWVASSQAKSTTAERCTSSIIAQRFLIRIVRTISGRGDAERESDIENPG
jgi:hypothetical protein